MDRWQGKLAVVTGASTGIGLATAKALKKHGLVVIGLARSKEKMEMRMKDAEGLGKFYACECDVASEQQVRNIFRWIRQEFGVIQIIVNNAGVAVCGTICDTSRIDWEHVFNVNVLAILECSKLTVKMIREADVEGHIININSIQGHRVYDIRSLESNVYSATKYATTSITETLRNELSDSKIRVTSVSPGAVATDILDNGGFDMAKGRKPTLKPEDVAQAIVFAIGAPATVEIRELIICPRGESR